MSAKDDKLKQFAADLVAELWGRGTEPRPMDHDEVEGEAEL